MSSQYQQIKKLISYYKPYKLVFLAVLSCAAISAIAALAIPLCIRFITVEALALGTTDAMPLIFKTLLLMLALIVIQTVSVLFYDDAGHAM